MRIKTIDGVEVHAEERDGRVLWLSDWTRCDELATAGHLRRVHRGAATFGHVDYYLP